MSNAVAQQQQGILGDPLFQVLSSPANANFVSPASGQPVIPSNEELNAMALLQKFDTDGTIKSMAQKDLAFIRAGAKLLAKDPFLRQQLGGSGFRQTLRLAGLMKQQFNQWLLQLRTAKMIPQMLGDLGFNTAESIAMITGTGGDALRASTAESISGLKKSIARGAVQNNADALGAISGALQENFTKDANVRSKNLFISPRDALINGFNSFGAGGLALGSGLF